MSRDPNTRWFRYLDDEQRHAVIINSMVGLSQIYQSLGDLDSAAKALVDAKKVHEKTGCFKQGRSEALWLLILDLMADIARKQASDPTARLLCLIQEEEANGPWLGVLWGDGCLATRSEGLCVCSEPSRQGDITRAVEVFKEADKVSRLIPPPPSP